MLGMSCLVRSLFFFFFSSRRRHTRLQCDWRSDVCSSDLHVEEDPAVDRVGVFAFDQPHDPVDHLIDVLGRPRRHVDREQTDLRHVAVEHAHLLGGQLAEVDTAFASYTQDVVVNIGDVAHTAHGKAGIAKPTVEHVEHVVDERVTHVRRVVRGDAADIDADPSAPRLEGHHLLAGGVEQLHAARFYGALRGALRGGSGFSTLRAASRIETALLKLSRALASSNPSQAASTISAGSGCSSAPSGASTMK